MGDLHFGASQRACFRTGHPVTEADPTPEPQKSMREESVDLASVAAQHNQNLRANRGWFYLTSQGLTFNGKHGST